MSKPSGQEQRITPHKHIQRQQMLLVEGGEWSLFRHKSVFMKPFYHMLRYK